jgi:hypothetical protein
MAQIDTVRSLVTFADLDDRDPRGCSVSARHEAVLSSGRHVLLLNDRGWTTSRWPEGQRAQDVERTARTVVGPDEPGRDQTYVQQDAAHWSALERTLHDAGVSTEGIDLRSLPHEVVLSERLLSRLPGGP